MVWKQDSKVYKEGSQRVKAYFTCLSPHEAQSRGLILPLIPNCVLPDVGIWPLL